MKKCPYCAEEIQDEAIVCRYCGRDLSIPPLPFVIIEEPKKRQETKRVVEEPKTQPQIVKKKDFSIAVLFTVIIGLVACVIFAIVQSNWTSSPSLDSASIKSTAVAKAWTSVSQTQIASTPPTPRPTARPPTPDRRTPFEKCSQSESGVIYIVVGSDEYTKASLTFQNDTGGTEQIERTLPICLNYDNFIDGDFVYISAQITSNYDAIKCFIYDGNRLISESKAQGFASIATCSGSK